MPSSPVTATATESWPFPDEKVDLTRQHGHPRNPRTRSGGFYEGLNPKTPGVAGFTPAGGVTQIHPHFGPTPIFSFASNPIRVLMSSPIPRGGPR